MTEEEIVPPYKDTKCKGCGTVDKPLFIMPRVVDAENFYCKDCQVGELETRTTA